MNNKSISPVIATIILVGIAIGASALLYSWFSGIQTGTQQVGGQTAGSITLATGSAMKIDTVTNAGLVTVRNIGSVNLTDITGTDTNSGTSAPCNSTSNTTVASLSPGSSNSTITCALKSGVNNIEFISSEGAIATYEKLQ
ncbi:hypothetical protein IPdc08_01428 [archaeon]|nr:hypothetical protein IPdc08_01428 [archaeon]